MHGNGLIQITKEPEAIAGIKVKPLLRLGFKFLRYDVAVSILAPDDLNRLVAVERRIKDVADELIDIKVIKRGFDEPEFFGSITSASPMENFNSMTPALRDAIAPERCESRSSSRSTSIPLPRLRSTGSGLGKDCDREKKSSRVAARVASSPKGTAGLPCSALAVSWYVGGRVCVVWIGFFID